MTEHAAEYLIAEAMRLRVWGAARVVRHFDAEYGRPDVVGAAAGDGGGTVPVTEPDVDVRIRFGSGRERLSGGALVVGRHKSARWRVALGPPDARPLRADVGISGGPPSFALSLVQGYFVEALVAIALARAGRIALPGAAFDSGDGVTILLGRSGAGKTTLTARALACGRTVLSDDQVVVDRGARAWRYPRRLRFYPDIRDTAPEAWSRLGVRTRATLALRGQVRRLTWGYVAPSLAVPATQLGDTVTAGPLPVQRLVVVERRAQDQFTATAREPAWVVEQVGAVLADQRARLSGAVEGPWARALDAALEEERSTAAATLAATPATQVIVPESWDARRAIDALDRHLGITPGRTPTPADGSPPSVR